MPVRNRRTRANERSSIASSCRKKWSRPARRPPSRNASLLPACAKVTLPPLPEIKAPESAPRQMMNAGGTGVAFGASGAVVPRRGRRWERHRDQLLRDPRPQHQRRDHDRCFRFDVYPDGRRGLSEQADPARERNRIFRSSVTKRSSSCKASPRRLVSESCAGLAAPIRGNRNWFRRPRKTNRPRPLTSRTKSITKRPGRAGKARRNAA